MVATKAPSVPEGTTNYTILKASDLSKMRESDDLSSSNTRTKKGASGYLSSTALQSRTNGRDREERNRHMKTIDQERKSAGVERTECEKEDDAKRAAQISKSRAQKDEELDDVKHMNKIMLYSKCVTIRDAQIGEKQQIKKELQEEEKRLDLAMEMERLKALKMYEEREKKRIEDRKKGAAVIRSQISEREKERLHNLELKQQEQEAMLSHIQKMKLEDKQESENKKKLAAQMMEEVAIANADQIRLKKRQREIEKEEVAAIEKYLQEKEKKEREQAELAERLRAERELETAKLRALQEKAQDKQAELDALRAKRAQEQYERDWRKREANQIAKQKQIEADLKKARAAQKLEKEMLLEEQAQMEREEFERILAVQRKEAQVERAKEQIEQQRRVKNAREQREQIRVKEEQRRKERMEYIEEGVRISREKQEELDRLALIKQNKVSQLDGQHVPSKYLVELKNKKIGVEALRSALE